MIDEDFRTLLATILPTGTTIEKGKISEERPTTRCFYERQAEDNDLFCNRQPGITTTVFDVEIAALDAPTMLTMILQVRNNCGTLTTLNGGINASVTSVVVASLAYLPTDGLPFVITVDSEKMLATAVNTATLTLTVTRGYKSTTAASHLTGAAVTAPGLDGYQGAMGDRAALGIFVQDQMDEYQPKMMDLDQGYFVGSFQASVATF